MRCRSGSTGTKLLGIEHNKIYGVLRIDRSIGGLIMIISIGHRINVMLLTSMESSESLRVSSERNPSIPWEYSILFALGPFKNDRQRLFRAHITHSLCCFSVVSIPRRRDHRWKRMKHVRVPIMLPLWIFLLLVLNEM